MKESSEVGLENDEVLPANHAKDRESQDTQIRDFIRARSRDWRATKVHVV